MSDSGVAVEMLAPVRRLSVDRDTRGMMKSESTAQFESQGMRILFKDLSYTVPSNENPKEVAYLLRDVSGFFQPGEMTALMGPSGSGKTTLLDVLAGRKTAGKTTGTLLFGGAKPSRAFLRRYTGYVEQFDTLLPVLTVEEMLLYTAELKRPMSEPLNSKKAAVEELLDALALTPCRDVRIGDPLTKGISGGQAKRTNIGIALITNPRVLFLDEPTSGLDSYTANETMTVVKNLLTGGVTVCATIHSPTATAFGLFDALMMLTRGRTVYFGPRGQAAVDYALASWPIKGSKSDTVANPAEFLVDLITGADREGRAAAFADTYAASPLAASNVQRLDAYIEAAATTKLPDHLAAELSVDHETVTPVWWGLKTLIKYRTPRNYKDPEFLGPRIGDKFLMTVLQWSLYWQIGGKFNGNNYANISAILFMFIVLPAYGAASYVPAIVLERRLFMRERADGLYYAITYLLAKLLDELMVATLASLPLCAASFYAMDFQNSFALFWVVYLLVLYIGVVLAYAIAAISPNMDVANALLPVWVTIQLLWAGFVSSTSAMPVWWKWFSYIDFLRYAWGALMVNQFSGAQGDPVWIDGKTVLEHYDLKNQDLDARYTWYTADVSMWANVGFLTIFFALYAVCAWLALKYVQHGAR